MTARDCFTAKIAAGVVSKRAGQRLLEQLDAFEQVAREKIGDDRIALAQAAREASDEAIAAAARRADNTRDAILHQSEFLQARVAYEKRLDELRATPGDGGFGTKAPAGIPFLLRSLKKETDSPLLDVARSFLMNDPREIATHNNVYYLARTIRERAHTQFIDAIEYLRSKNFGFKQEAVRELDVLRTAHGRTDVQPGARQAFDAFRNVEHSLADQFIEAGGAMAKRENYFPNPSFDAAKVRALGLDQFRALMRGEIDRSKMIDFDTGKPLSDLKFERLFDEATQSIHDGGAEGAPSAARHGEPSLGNSRQAARLFVYKDAESWMRVAEAAGTHASPYQAMVEHITGMAEDIAMMRILGRNPETFRAFIADQFAREPARLAVATADLEKGGNANAARINRRIEGRARGDAKQFQNLWDEISGANSIPVDQAMATALGDVRAALGAAQLGQAILSSLSDTATLMITSRLNGLPVMKVLGRGVELMSRKGAEIEAAQAGVIADSLAHGSQHADRIMGETIRSGIAGRLVQGVIRASGLRAWTARLRAAFAMEMMAKFARDRHLPFAELDPQFRTALDRYGIDAKEWATLKNVEDFEPRPGAPFLRAQDVAALGTSGARLLSEKLSRLLNTEMDHAVIETDPLARARLLGDSRPGTISGEARRAVGMYRSFTLSLMTLHFARAVARGWDGSRLGHAGLTFLAMTAFGALSMQAKELNAGRNPLSLDPATGLGRLGWGKAMIQGGGLGVFGDMLFVDKTKFGNNWSAILAGPMGSLAESVLGNVLLKNITLAAKGKDTHFLGDLAYVGGHLIPGSNLAPAKLAFQAAVLDQAALMLDDRARERFARIEQQARKDWGQTYWRRPGRLEADAPDFGAMFGR